VAASTDDPLELRAHVLSILMAAKDSTAAGLSSTFYLLARHPEVWNRLSIEIGELNGKIPTFDQLKKLKYVYNVINEGISWVRASCFVQNFDVIRSDATISTGSNQCSSSNNRYLPS
jgi:cytochrome P450